MKIILFITLIFLLFSSAYGQLPSIGIIDFYGLKTVTAEQVRSVLQLKEGDVLPASKTDVEKRILSLPNVEDVRVNGICCDSGKMILYVGIKEKGARTLQFRTAPKGKIRLPDEIINTDREFFEALKTAGLKGDVAEDDSEGHSLMKNAEARLIQEKFIPIANNNLSLLRKVLYESSDAEHRAVAVQIIAYYKDKNTIVKDLVYGIKDENEIVRNNSMRALGVLARFAHQNPTKNIKIPLMPFVEMLNSLEWSDRNKSSMALWQLTESRDKSLLTSLREKALQSLIEMSRWKSFGHAVPAFFIIARIADVPDAEIVKMWQSGRREELIEKVNEISPEK